MKKITVRDIFNYLNQWAPASLAEEWDPVGLQVGSLKSEVKGVLVSLDVTFDVLKEAKKKKCNLLITHHPLMGKKEAGSIPARLAQKSKREKINILSFHTNLDSTEEGLNDLLASTLKLKKIKALIPSRDKKRPRAGLGRIGEIPPMSFRKFLSQTSRLLVLKNFRFVGALQKKIRRVAVMTGSGAGFCREALKQKADVLVTGDVTYHTALDALTEGIALVDIGHFAGEIGMMSAVVDRLKTDFHSSIKIWESRVQSDPFQFWPL